MMTASTPTIVASPFITRAELAQFLRLSKARISWLIARDLLPRPVKPSSKRELWRREEIEAWLAAGSPDGKAWAEMQSAVG